MKSKAVNTLLSIATSSILCLTQAIWAGPSTFIRKSPLSGISAKGQGPVTVAEIKGMGLTDILAPLLDSLTQAKDKGNADNVKELIESELEKYRKDTGIQIIPEWETLQKNPDTGLTQIVLRTQRNGNAKNVLFTTDGNIQNAPVKIMTFGYKEAVPYIKETIENPETKIKKLSTDDAIVTNFVSYISQVAGRRFINKDELSRMGFKSINEYRNWLNKAKGLVENKTINFQIVDAPSYIEGVSVPAIIIRYINGKLYFISAYIDKNSGAIYTAKEFVDTRKQNKPQEIYAVWLHEISHYLGASEPIAIAREQFLIGLTKEAISQVWAKTKEEVRNYWQAALKYVEESYGIEVNPFLQKIVKESISAEQMLVLANAYRETFVRNNMLGYLYKANRIKETENIAILAKKIRQRQETIGKPIKAVVVLGIGGQSLGNRSILQALGIRSNLKFLYPDNIGRPQVWLDQLNRKGIKGDEVLLYISSKSGKTDEVMSNMQIFWEWQIQSIASERQKKSAGKALIEKIRNLNNITQPSIISQVPSLTKEERDILNTTLKLMVVNTTLDKNNPLYQFAKNNVVPKAPRQLTQIPENIMGRYTILSESGWFTTAIGGWDIKTMQERIQPAVEAFKSGNPEENPALKAALYTYLAQKNGERPILAVAVNGRKFEEKYKIQITPVLEWMRQLVMESLGKEGKGPYLYFLNSQEKLNQLAKNKTGNIVYLGLNIGKAEISLPENRPGISVNIQHPNINGLAQLYLFLEEFTVRYASLLAVNPVNQPWVDRFKKLLKKTASSNKERERIYSKMSEAQTNGPADIELADSNIISQNEGNATFVETLLNTAVKKSGAPMVNSGLEAAAQKAAKFMYLAGLAGKKVNPIFIYSNSPKAQELGRRIKELGLKRFSKYGGLIWDYLIGTTDQHSSAQWLGAGTNIAYTTFIHFIINGQESGEQPVIRENGLVQPYLTRLTPKEISTFYLEAVRKAFTNENRLNTTIEVPVENEQAQEQLKNLFTRIDTIYSEMLNESGKSPLPLKNGEDKKQGPSATKESSAEIKPFGPQLPALSNIVQNQESTLINPEKGGKILAGPVLDERPVTASGTDEIISSLLQAGVKEKYVFNPNPKDGYIRAKVGKSWNRFLARLEVLEKSVKILMNIKNSFLQRLNPVKQRKNPRIGIYAFRFEDTIANLDIRNAANTSAKQIAVKNANIMIAKVIKQIKKSSPNSRFIVYSQKYTRPQMEAALQHIDCGGIFHPDSIIQGNINTVQKMPRDPKDRLVIASREPLNNIKIRRVIPGYIEGEVIGNEKFVPFPELASIMQELVYTDAGPLKTALPIDNLVNSYRIWLELCNLSPDEIEKESTAFRLNLENSNNLSVNLPIPPTPMPGSVIDRLDQEYNSTKGNITFA